MITNSPSILYIHGWYDLDQLNRREENPSNKLREKMVEKKLKNSKYFYPPRLLGTQERSLKNVLYDM